MLVDAANRPYFLLDSEMTLDEFREQLAHGDREVRAYLVGKLMRQAKPDDALSFVNTAELTELWPDVQPYLGRSRPLWEWLMTARDLLPR